MRVLKSKMSLEFQIKLSPLNAMPVLTGANVNVIVESLPAEVYSSENKIKTFRLIKNSKMKFKLRKIPTTEGVVTKGEALV
jgi:alpha-tubulin suppressor-like RCC1 family protein